VHAIVGDIDPACDETLFAGLTVSSLVQRFGHDIAHQQVLQSIEKIASEVLVTPKAQ
jgi:hypothetical protein